MFISNSHRFLIAKIREILGEQDLEKFFNPTVKHFPEKHILLAPRSALFNATKAPAPFVAPSDPTAHAQSEEILYLFLGNIIIFESTPLGQFAKRTFKNSQEFFAVYGLFNPLDLNQNDKLDEMIYTYPRDIFQTKDGECMSIGLTLRTKPYTPSLLIQILWFITRTSYSITRDEKIFENLFELTNEVRCLFFLERYTRTVGKDFVYGEDKIYAACKKSPAELNLDKLKTLFLLCCAESVAPSTLVLSLYSAVQRILGHADTPENRRSFFSGIGMQLLEEYGTSSRTYVVMDVTFHTENLETFRMQPKFLNKVMQTPEIQFSPQIGSHAALTCSGSSAVTPPSSNWLPLQQVWQSLQQLCERYARTKGALHTFLSSQEKKGILGTGIMGELSQASSDAAMLNLLGQVQIKRSPKNEPPHTLMFSLLIDLWVQLSEQTSHMLFHPSAILCNHFLTRLIRCLDEDSLHNQSHKDNRSLIGELFIRLPAPQRAEITYNYWSFCLAVLVPKWNQDKYKMIMTLINNKLEDMKTLLAYLKRGRLHAPGLKSKLSWPENFNKYLTFCCEQFEQYHELYQSYLTQKERNQAPTQLSEKFLIALKDLEERMKTYNIPEIFRDKRY
ncbi:MAG: hypothetical protein EXR81_03165 [Gammaproteobacteria bacterium]|nr:hypothetical protein [Gammaproteobacteria bacterium]